MQKVTRWLNRRCLHLYDTGHYESFKCGVISLYADSWTYDFETEYYVDCDLTSYEVESLGKFRDFSHALDAFVRYVQAVQNDFELE